MNTNNRHIFSIILASTLMCVVMTFRSYAGEVVPQDCADCFSCDGGATITTEEPGNLTYRWINNQGDEIFQEQNDLGESTVTDLCPGIYFVAISEDNLTLETHSFNVAVVGTDPGGNAEIFTCTSGNSFNLVASLEGTPMPGGIWSDGSGGAISGTYNPTTAGSQTLTYTLDAGGCDVSAELTIVTNEPAYPGNSTTYDICDHYKPFELFDVLNENPEPNGEWLNTEGEVFDGIFVPGVDPSGQYIYRIDTVPGCPPVYSNVNMDVHEYPNAGNDTTLIVCAQAEEIDLADYLADGADADGVWRDPQNQVISSLIDPSNDEPGNYKYVVTGTTPCPTISSTFELVIDTLVTAGNDTEAQVCEISEEINLFDLLGGSPDDYGEWVNDSGEQIDGIFNPDNNTSQSFQYLVEAIGCAAELATLELEINEQPQAGLDSSITVCENTTNLELSSFLSNDAWTTGSWQENGNQISNVNYSPVIGFSEISYIVGNGACPADTAALNIQVDVLPENIEDQDWQFCNSDGEVTISDELGGGITDLSFFEIESNLEVESFLPSEFDGEGFYSVAYSSNTCPNDTSVIGVEIIEKAFQDTIISTSVCESVEMVNLDSFLADDFPEGGVWSDVSDPVNQDQLIDSPGEFQFYYTVENGEVCENSVLALGLHVSDQLSAGEGGSINICESDAILDLNTLISADGSESGSWWYNNQQLEDPLWNPAENGSGMLEYSVVSEDPCPISVAEFEILVDEEVVISLPEGLSACANSDSEQILIEANGEYEYVWEESPLLSSSDVSAPWLIFSAASNNYLSDYLSVTVNNGACQKTDSLHFEIMPYPEVSLYGDVSLCEGEGFQFEAAGAENYEWISFPAGSEASAETLTGTALNDFQLSVQGFNSFGCSGLTSADVSVFERPAVDLNIEGANGCSPVSLTLSFDADQEIASHYWMLNGDFLNPANGSTILLEEPGEYLLELNATNQNACSTLLEAEDVFEVFENPEADFVFAEESVEANRPQVNILNTSTSADFYFWNFGHLGSSVEENPTMYLTDEIPGFYEACLTAETDFGCSDSICKTIELEGLFSVYIPNAFTPDGDGLNEAFRPVMEGIDPGSYHMIIFDRWGDVVFESNNPDQPWIGNYKGGNHYVPPAIYNWRLKVKNKYTGEIEKLSGHISLLR